MKIPTANLDLLRATAVAAVFVDHLAMVITWRLQVALPRFFFELGLTGVLAFFVHTSLVLMYSLERTDGKVGPFYIRRIFRIYPLAIAFVLFAVAARVPPLPMVDFVRPTPGLLFSNLFLVQNFIGKSSLLAPMWSLPYELQMYVALPALFLLCRPDQRWSLVVLAVGLALVVLILRLNTGHAALLTYIPCFMAGVLCYAFGDLATQRIRPAFWPIFVWLWFGSLAFLQSFAPGGTLELIWNWIFCGLLGVAIGAFRDLPAGRIAAVCKWVARYSYGIYLAHVPALWLTFRVADIRNLVLGSLLSLALTLVISVVLYHLLEEPMIKFGQKIAHKLGEAPMRPFAPG
jgi:peptidoglycan/LPS O-acetylase OafA/YrhL